LFTVACYGVYYGYMNYHFVLCFVVLNFMSLLSFLLLDMVSRYRDLHISTHLKALVLLLFELLFIGGVFRCFCRQLTVMSLLIVHALLVLDANKL